MYSDSISNYTTPHDQSGVNVYQPISNLTGSDDYACNHLLGKRCTVLNHDIFCPSIKHVDHNASHLRKQKLAMHVNTRHMDLRGIHRPRSGVPNHQHDTLAPVQNLVDQSTSNVIPDQNNSGISSDGQISTENDTFSKTKPTFRMNQQKRCNPYNIFLPKVSKKPFIVPSKTVLPTPLPNHSIDVAVSNNQTTVGHVNTRGIAHAGFLESVQRWANAIEHVCDARKQQLHHELFGDEPTLTANASELLKVLKHIDQKKNQITCEEEHATGLIEAIFKVQETCGNSTEKESIMLASKILDNLLQRFYGWEWGNGAA